MKSKLVLSIVVVVVLLVVVLLVNAGQAEVSRVFTPSELKAELKSSETSSLARIRLAARVAQAKIDYQVEPEFVLKFAVADPPKDGKEADLNVKSPLQVVYFGIKPDMFAVGRDVIIDGEYRSGVFYANKLLTQCPSKYEPPTPQE